MLTFLMNPTSQRSHFESLSINDLINVYLSSETGKSKKIEKLVSDFYKMMKDSILETNPLV
jgi:hypothetical protein